MSPVAYLSRKIEERGAVDGARGLQHQPAAAAAAQVPVAHRAVVRRRVQRVVVRVQPRHAAGVVHEDVGALVPRHVPNADGLVPPGCDQALAVLQPRDQHPVDGVYPGLVGPHLPERLQVPHLHRPVFTPQVHLEEVGDVR